MSALIFCPIFPVSECALTKAIRKLIISKSVRGATTRHPRIIISQIFLRTDTKERITIGVLKCNQSSYHLVSCWILFIALRNKLLPIYLNHQNPKLVLRRSIQILGEISRLSAWLKLQRSVVRNNMHGGGP